MNKEFKYVSMQECVNVLFETVESFVEHKSALLDDIIDKKADPRKEFNELFDFESETLRTDVYEECNKVLTNRISEENPDYSTESEEIQNYVSGSIEYFIRWVKARSEEGYISWDELMNHLHKIPWRETVFGIRIQRFGKVYYELRFNYMQEVENGYLKFFNAEYQEDEDILYAGSYVAFGSKDIESIYMGYADLMYGVGLRDVTITYADGETVFLRFSEEN